MLKCLIVDDEPLARGVVRDFLSQIPDVEVVAEAGNASVALKTLKEEAVDAIFLDIQMPGLSGIDLVRAIPSPPLVVFITAYPEHAVDGFSLDAVDYLVKPFSFSRLLEAVNRLRKRLAPSPILSQYITFKADKRLHKIPHTDLRYIQAAGDFIKVFHSGKTLIVNETLRSLETRLPTPPFCRIHKSYLVNLDYLKYWEGNQVAIDDEMLPVGAAHREALKQILNGPQG
ncbi:MAG TPA: DNA-binding response regulator [Cytophagales bacterium]|nr:DNA-binding response regulator [Cytophagales bacterium]HAA20016.1 DNA-binding response regulator [Cytophagales bacterium]HAP64659.1 DNA-binding response regulator [Cytophagales bacterium]